MNLLPYFWSMVPTTDFQDDIRSTVQGRLRARLGLVKHVEGLADSAAHYGDKVFNYYLFANMQVIGGDHDLHRRRSSPRCSTSAAAGCCRSGRSR